jgi:hypothetical protein
VIAPGETFAPPPAWAKPKRDGVQAWDKSFLGRGKGSPRPIPADISYQLGLLTVPPSVTDVLAWGYSSPPGRCPPPMGVPRPSPAPETVIALRSVGFVSSDVERYPPQRLVVQGPLSTIRWTFRAATCSIDLHWFMTPQLQRGPARAPCPWRHRFSLNVVGASRGNVF